MGVVAERVMCLLTIYDMYRMWGFAVPCGLSMSGGGEVRAVIIRASRLSAVAVSNLSYTPMAICLSFSVHNG